ncbi:MAG: 4-hydroxy-3-methylbut-2-enyl diphosphate reductase [Candidatus Magnetoovum sp. WYHC-5]|nr:4-hydroxy-3-methylbut-2-enyl diphosphate reductase [Candidatus Magnetoovum sp. WYHC-5]
MDITLAKRAGFCFGVKRAVKIAFELASKRDGVCTLGPIIHNPQVVEKLSQKGVFSVDEPSKEMKSVIIRTHGIPVAMYERLDATGVEIIDATCPFVKKAQEYAKLLRNEGYQVIILGDKDHPEVKSIMSFVGDDVIVVKNGENPRDINPNNMRKLDNKVGIVVQTTQPLDALRRLLNVVVEKAKELKVYNTICNSTALRQKETREICQNVEMMIVAGGKNSANTTQLATLCLSTGVHTYHIETADEIDPLWFNGVSRVGVTAGASTPDWIIEEIVKRINNI